MIYNNINKGGFTLLELTITVVIIAVLSTVVFVAVSPSKRLGQTNNTIRFEESKNIARAIKTALLDNDVLPAEITSVAADTYYSLVVDGGSISGQYTCDALSQDIDRLDIVSTIEPYISEHTKLRMSYLYKTYIDQIAFDGTSDELLSNPRHVRLLEAELTSYDFYHPVNKDGGQPNYYVTDELIK